MERVSEVVLERHLAYSHHSMLQFSNFSISSEKDPHQGIHLESISFVWHYIHFYGLPLAL